MLTPRRNGWIRASCSTRQRHEPVDDWLAKSVADFRSMNWAMQAPTIHYDDVIFHAQQCIEKLLKCLLTARWVDSLS
jgi:hypothetical protein